MARLLLLLLVAVGFYFLLRWMFRQPPRVYWQIILVVLAAVLLTLVITGRAHWLTVVFAALLPFVRFLFNLLAAVPLIKRLLVDVDALKSRQPPKGGQKSSVQSRYIRMTLDHDSGEIDGEVLTGQFQGRRLAELDLDTLLQLLRDCSDDEESVALLQSYLDRVYADSWQQQAGEQEQRQNVGQPGDMSRDEALQILGLSVGASEAEIVEAHRRLMQKLHPDRGGSAYLAAKINLAKDTLLGR